MTKQYEVYWTKFAESDLDEIIDYIAQDNLNAAVALFHKIRDKCQTLNIFPYRCRVVPELNKINIKTLRELIIRPYRVIFKLENNCVYIMGVFDGRHDLEEILIDRLIR